jgi:predicted nucleic-acid-binding Zn-ribbon protein
MKDGICPKCGSDEVFKKASNKIALPWIRQSYPLNYVCADCGYMEWYIEKRDDLEVIRFNWKRANPKFKRKNDE